MSKGVQYAVVNAEINVLANNFLNLQYEYLIHRKTIIGIEIDLFKLRNHSSRIQSNDLLPTLSSLTPIVKKKYKILKKEHLLFLQVDSFLRKFCGNTFPKFNYLDIKNYLEDKFHLEIQKTAAW